MFRARERGMSFWPFAISLLLLIAFVIMWFSASSERDQAFLARDRAEAARKSMEEEKTAKLTQLGNLSKTLGFLAGSNFSDPAEMERQMKEYAQKLKDTMTLTFPADRYTPGEGTAVVEKTSGGNVTIVYLTEAELADVPTFQAYLSKFEVAAKRMKMDIDRMVNSAAQAVSEKEAVVKTDRDTITAKEARIDELTKEKAALDSRMHEQENDLKAQLAQKDATIAKAQSDLDATTKQASANEAKLIAQVNEATGQVRTLVQREAPQLSEGPDGEVVVADNGVAILNRGKSQWLMPGTIFDVLGRAKGGATYKKGSIKVTNVDNDTARAAILEENGRDPITRGDLIQSLTYSPNRSLHFVLIGDFKRMGRSQAEALLKKLGATVDAKVSSETNYLVVGATPAGQESLDDSEAVKTAKDLGIRMITEEQLASFARY